MGEPHGLSELKIDLGVYPHAGGGTSTPPTYVVPTGGLSPRGWGNHDAAPLAGVDDGSIPTRVGEPHDATPWEAVEGVYPHAGGGTGKGGDTLHPAAGLSPRGWGNHIGAPEGQPQEGSIPTRVGEPSPSGKTSISVEVYPHAGGGTAGRAWSAWLSEGLSPRGWGNLRGRPDAQAGVWSIPTRVGEPRPARRTKSRSRVYPHAGGGTAISLGTTVYRLGLSPRGWGNRRRRAAACPGPGSIPTRVGEPCTLQGPAHPIQVYPHAGGGTINDGRHTRINAGLSPRGWGNPMDGVPDEMPIGSIPTRVGEPFLAAISTYRCWVYPHAGGGTPLTVWPIATRSGLSPRGWGNPIGSSTAVDGIGSIPTRVGEPTGAIRVRYVGGVYPHAGGGTSKTPKTTPEVVGLSPRGWGNRHVN